MLRFGGSHGRCTRENFGSIFRPELRVKSKLCGLTHYDMVKGVRIVDRAEYDQWYEENFGGATAAVAEESEQSN